MRFVNRLKFDCFGGIGLQFLSMYSLFFSQFAFLKFHRDLGSVTAMGILVPVVIRTGRCWLWGKSSNTTLLAGSTDLSLLVVTKARSRLYSLRQRAEKKVPLSRGL